MRGQGRVILVGAGPGDPELLTLKALRALREADVVLHDDLVHPEVLSYARAGARLIAVGKRGGCPSTPQAFIEQLMVREARAGHVVVRLKGGDPFVFGRGGEELAALDAAGIAVEIIPGITSGLAASAAIGIPVTHRDHAHGVALVTGHAARDGNDRDHGDASANEPNWEALVRSKLTLVIYMGLARVEVIAARLSAAGMRGDMPIAIIANATRPEQVAASCTLATMVTIARSTQVASPAIIVVGKMATWARSESAIDTAVKVLA